MKLDINTINKIAKLARIKLSEDESKDLVKDMNSILDWVEQLNEVNTEINQHINIHKLYCKQKYYNSCYDF